MYGAIQALWSGWAQRRYRAEFDSVKAFCLFVGYPRSGHSLVGAMLNAHRDAVISHELNVPELVLAGCPRDQVYARILARAAWFNLRGNRSNYRYQVPNHWQGRFETLRVIGDKGGGWVTQWLGMHPDLLQRFRETTRVPLRIIHVVRNPFDNIAAISKWHRLSLDESIDFYFAHCAITGKLGTLADDAELCTVRHEDFIRTPDQGLSALCAFLNLEPGEEYLAACSSIVFSQPTGSRRRVAWTASQLAEVEGRGKAYPFLEGYGFDPVGEPGRDPDSVSPPQPGPTHRGSAPSALDRIAAFLNPRVRG